MAVPPNVARPLVAKINIHGQTAFLYFECHDVALTNESATVPARSIVTDLFNAGTIRRHERRWLVEHMVFGSAPVSLDTTYYP